MMRKIFAILLFLICAAYCNAQTSGLTAPPPPVCSSSNAGALYTQTGTSPYTVWTCSYYNLAYQWVVNPSYGGVVYYPTLPTTCNGALPVFLSGWPDTKMYLCEKGVPTLLAGYSGNIVGSFTYSGDGSPTATCSATTNNGWIAINGSATSYQCSNATGAYQWNVLNTSFQHNGTNLPSQSLLNFYDSDYTPPSGNTKVTFDSATSGQLSAYVPLAGSQFSPTFVPPQDGQYVIIYGTPTIHQGVDGRCYPLGFPNSQSGKSGKVSPASTGGELEEGPCGISVGDNLYSLTWSNYTLPSSINPANVTAVYAFAISNMLKAPNSTVVYGPICDGQSLVPVAAVNSSWSMQQVNALINTADFLAGTVTCAASLNNTIANNFMLSDMIISKIGLVVYYTGDPIPQPEYTNIQWPLTYNDGSNTISISLPFDFSQSTDISDNYFVNLGAYPNGLVNGMTIRFLPAANNTTTTPQLTLNGFSVKTIVKQGGSALAVGDLSTTNIATVVYDATADKWELQNPQTVSTSPAFSNLSNGTNTTAAMIVGAGASLGVTGTGTIQATNIAGTISPGTNVTITGSGTTASPYVINSSGGGGGSGVTQIFAGNNVTVDPTGGTGAVTVSSPNSAQLDPSNTLIFVASDSRGHLSSSHPGYDGTATAVTCTVASAACIVTMNQSFSAGDHVELGHGVSGSFSPSYLIQPGLYTVLSTGLSSTQFEVAYTGTSDTTGTGGDVLWENYAWPYVLQNLAAVSGHGTVQNWASYTATANGTTIENVITDYPTYIHPYSPAVTGNNPEYLIVNVGYLDLVQVGSGCSNPASSVSNTETQLQTLWNMAHADGWIVVATTIVPDTSWTGCSTNQQGLAVSLFQTVNQWIRDQGPTYANKTSNNGWDKLLDLASVLDNYGYYYSDTLLQGAVTHHYSDAAHYLIASNANQLFLSGSPSLPRGYCSWADNCAQTNAPNIFTTSQEVSFSGNPGIFVKDPGSTYTIGLAETNNTDGAIAVTNGYGSNVHVMGFQAITGGIGATLNKNESLGFNNGGGTEHVWPIDTALSRDSTRGSGVMDLGTGALNNKSGTLQLTSINGSATAPTGTCTSAQTGDFQFTHDGKITQCNGTTWLNYASILPSILYSAAGTALPTCNAAYQGALLVVSDATTPTYMGSYTSGGTITTAVICSYDGTNYAWLTH